MGSALVLVHVNVALRKRNADASRIQRFARHLNKVSEFVRAENYHQDACREIRERSLQRQAYGKARGTDHSHK